MSISPKTDHDWVYETIDVNSVEKSRERLNTYQRWVVIVALAITAWSVVGLFQLHLAGNLDVFNQGWGIVAFAFSMALLIVVGGVLIAQSVALSHISRDALAQLAQDITECPGLKKQLLQQFLLQNNVIYEAQHTAFQAEFRKAQTDKVLAEFNANTSKVPS